MNFLNDIFENLITIYEVMVQSLIDFNNELSALTEQVLQAGQDNNFIINKTLGAVRYIVGDPIYLAFYLSITLGLLYTIYILITGVLNTIRSARIAAFKVNFGGL